ncbi:nectin-3-like protein [Engraulis encrasicolus]|uniref:nectin-3-like protein n=1 Tax=Engraulis encrasicolus TaxID=184585 RepID=UPI002FCF025A
MILLSVFLCLVVQAKALEVIVDDPLTVTVQGTITLTCQLRDFQDKIIQVDWIKKRRGNEDKIYTILRNGTTVPEAVNGLKGRLDYMGNAIDGEGSIRLKNATLTDEAVYKCRFILFRGNPIHKEFQLHVQAPPEVALVNVTPEVGLCEVTLATCVAAMARPPAEVIWDVGSLQGIVSVNRSAENSDGTTNVTVDLVGVPSRNLRRSVVQCMVRHPTLKSEKVVGYSLNFTYPPESVKINVVPSDDPQSPEFVCEANANPMAIRYTWSRNGAPLLNDRVQHNKLPLSVFDAEFNGLYACQVDNQYGQGEAYLHVYTANTRHRCVVAACFTFFIGLALGVAIPVGFLYFRYREIVRQFFQRPPEGPPDQPTHVSRPCRAL